MAPESDGTPVPLETALEDVAESLRLSAQTMADVMPSRDKARLIGKVLWVAAGSAVLTVMVGGVLLWAVFGSILPSQRILQRATSPKAQQATSQQTGNLVNRIILCDENHTNRVLELVLHMPLSAVPTDCPKDVLP